MEAPFWSLGPVPEQLLDRLAIARPTALQALTQALRETGYGVISGPPESGRTTLALQVARALGVPALMFNCAAMLKGDADEFRAHLQTHRPGAAWPPDDPDGPVLLILDSLDPDQADWARRLAKPPTRMVLAVGLDGGIEPDTITPEAARQFLAARARLAGRSWTAPALRAAVELAGDSPASLQRLGAACLSWTASHRQSRIGSDAYLEGALAVAGMLPIRYAAALAGLPTPRLALLKAMVRHPTESATQWAQRCGLEPKAAVVHLARLVRRDGLVVRSAPGEYSLQSPLLRMHLQARFGSVIRRIKPDPGVL